MDQRLKNTIARFLKLSRFFTQWASAVQSVPKLTARVGEFEGLRAKLPVVAADTDAAAPTVGARHGATDAKSTDRAQVIKLLVPAMSALNQYFEEDAQKELQGVVQKAAEMDLRRPSALLNMETTAFVSLYTKTLAYWDALPKDALKEYDQHDDIERKALRTATKAFDGTQTLPTEVRDDQHNAGVSVEQQAEALALFVKTPLTKAVNLLHDKNPPFVKAFKQANKTDDRRGGHAPAVAPVPAPVVP